MLVLYISLFGLESRWCVESERKSLAREMSSTSRKRFNMRNVRRLNPPAPVRDVAGQYRKWLDAGKNSNRKTLAIFGKKYCLPDGKAFRLEQLRLNDNEYVFRVKDKEGKLNWKIIMYDPAREDNNKFSVHDNEDKIIMTLQDSVLLPKGSWLPTIVRPRFKVYKGDSTDDKDFLFTVRRPRMLWKCDLEVFLPSTKEEEGGFDFEVMPKWWEAAEFVVKDKGGDILAQGSPGRGWFNDRSYNVTVSPNVDYAFMVALTLMFYEIFTGGASSRLPDPDDIFSDSD